MIWCKEIPLLKDKTLSSLGFVRSEIMQIHGKTKGESTDVREFACIWMLVMYWFNINTYMRLHLSSYVEMYAQK